MQHKPEDLVRNHFNFIPKHGRNRTLDAVCDTLENINLPVTGIHNSKPNLSKNEQSALKDLRNDRSIIIKEADKGEGVVIMNRDFYEDKISTILHDTDFYHRISKTQENKTISKIKKPCQWTPL